MIVDIACDAFPVIIRAASLPASVEWKSNVIGSVDYGPQRVSTRSKSESFGVTNAFGKKSTVSAIQIVPIDGTPDGITTLVSRVRVGG